MLRLFMEPGSYSTSSVDVRKIMEIRKNICVCGKKAVILQPNK